MKNYVEKVLPLYNFVEKFPLNFKLRHYIDLGKFFDLVDNFVEKMWLSTIC